MINDYKTRLAVANYYQEIADGLLFSEAADEAAQLVQEDIQDYARTKLAELFGEPTPAATPRRQAPAPLPMAIPVRQLPTPSRRPALLKQPTTPDHQVAPPVRRVAAPPVRPQSALAKARQPVIEEPEEETESTVEEALLPQDGEIRRENGQDWRYTWHEIHLDQIEGDASPLMEIPILGVGEVEGRMVYRAATDMWWWIRRRTPTARSRANPATSWDKNTIEMGTAMVSQRAAAIGGSMNRSSAEDALSRDPNHP